MKVMLTGGLGMLGRTIAHQLGDEFDIVVTDYPEADITNQELFSQVLREIAPDVVIHCAAATDVDRCESDFDWAYQLNAIGSAHVAQSCRNQGVRLIAISTDYVFDGESNLPYKESDFADGGHTAYGRTKFAGEKRIHEICEDYCICRISWLYGFGGPSFVHTMLKLADGTRPVLKVVGDQRGNPTSALAVAEELKHLLRRPELTGIFHMTCEGETTWAEFAEEIFRLAGKDQKIEPCTTEEFPRPAPRPKNSCLEKARLRKVGLPPMPDWKTALSTFMHIEFEGGVSYA